MTRKILILTILFLFAATVAGAQIPAPPTVTAAGTVMGPAETPPIVPGDPLAQKSGGEGWVWAMRYWSPPAEPRDLAGGRVQGMLGVGRWGFALRGDASGMPGEFAVDKIQTFRTIEANIGVHRNLAAAQGIQVGAAIGAGLAVSLEQGEDGLPPKTPNNFSYGVGGRAAGKGWWVYLMVGQHQALPGFSAICTYQVKISDRTAAVGTMAYGAQQRYIAQLGIAVRWW
jgi:hypothetical protein